MNEEIFRKDCNSIINNYKDTYNGNLTSPEIDTLGEIIIKEMKYLEKQINTRPLVKNLFHDTRDTEEEIVMKLQYNRKYFTDTIIEINQDLSDQEIDHFTSECISTFKEDELDSIYDTISEAITKNAGYVLDPELVMAYQQF